MKLLQSPIDLRPGSTRAGARRGGSTPGGRDGGMWEGERSLRVSHAEKRGVGEHDQGRVSSRKNLFTG